MRVALLANLKKNAPTWPGIAADRWDELDSEKTVEAIAAALQTRGHTVTFLEGTPALASDLAKLRPDHRDQDLQHRSGQEWGSAG